MPVEYDTPSKNCRELLHALSEAVGTRNVLSSAAATRRYTRGFRYGAGKVSAVVRPDSLLELWKVFELCIAADVIVIPQAANTGLTGGSTPFGDDYDREVVVINTMRLKGLHLLGGGEQVIAFPGTTLDELETALEPLGREPHSVIGSSCLGASVIGGICNNSGGSLIQRGPAYTEMALYAYVDEDGKVQLVNKLGLALGDTPLEIMTSLDDKLYGSSDVKWDQDAKASDGEYQQHVRDIASDQPARFNADPRRLVEASGSAGRLMVFAVRLDTFEKEKDTKVFYIGTNDPDDLTAIRREMLSPSMPLPIAAEYIHREAFDIAERYGKDTYILIKRLGTRRLPRLFALKARLDGLLEQLPFLPDNPSDRLLQFISRLFPSHLPSRLLDFRDRFDHHLMLKVGGEAIEPTRRLLADRFPNASSDVLECSLDEGAAAFLHRFAAAGAAIRYQIVHRRVVGDIIALDIALPRNTADWLEELPKEIDDRVIRKLYYGHFFCYVFHQDYIIDKSAAWRELKHDILATLEVRTAVRKSTTVAAG